MSAGLIGGVGQSQTPVSANNQFAEMSSEEFVNILVTELTNQDPLEPTDTTAILEQLGSLRNIESQVQLQERLENLVQQNELAAASGLIGKVVSGLTDSNDSASGLVTSIRVKDDRAYLELDSGQTLRVDRVTEITDLSQTV